MGNDAWAASVGEQYQRLSPLSFKLRPISDVIKKFGLEDEHFKKFVDVLDAKIKEKWEAATDAAVNVQVDQSTCGDDGFVSGLVSGCSIIHLSGFVAALIVLAFA